MATAAEIDLVIRARNMARQTMLQVRKDLDLLRSSTGNLGNSFIQMGRDVQRILMVELANAAVHIGMVMRRAVSEVVDALARWENAVVLLEKASKDSAIPIQQFSEITKRMGYDLSLLGIGPQEAAEGLTILYRAGLETTQIFTDLQGYLAGTTKLAGAFSATMKLAASSELSSAQAAEYVIRLMNTFKLAAKDVDSAIDLVVQAAEASPTSVEQFLAALEDVGPTAAFWGVSLRDVLTHLAMMSKYGIEGSEAGVALKSAWNYVIRPVDAVTEGLKKMNIQLYDAYGKMRPWPDFVKELGDKMFGTFNVMELLGGATKTQEKAFKEYQTEIDNAKETLREYEAGIRGTGQSEKVRGRILKEARDTITYYTKAQEMLGIEEEKLTNVTRTLTEKERNLVLYQMFGVRGQRAMAGVLKEGSAEWDKMGVSIDKSATATTIYTAKLDTLQAQFSIFRKVMATLGIDIAEEALTPLKDMMKDLNLSLVENAPAITQWFKNLTDWLTAKIPPAVKNIGAVFRGLKAILSGWGDQWTSIFPPWLEPTIDSIAEASWGYIFPSWAIQVIKALKTEAIILWNTLKNLFTTIFDFAKGNIFPIITQNIQAFIGAIVALTYAIIAAMIISKLAGWFQALTSPIGLLVIAIGLLGAAWRTNWMGMRTVILGVWTAIKPTFDQLVAIFRSSLPAAFGALKGLVEQTLVPILKGVLLGIPTAMKDLPSLVQNSILPAFLTLIGLIQTYLPMAIGLMVRLVSAVATAVGTQLKTLAPLFMQAFSFIFGTVLPGLIPMLIPILTGIINVAGAIIGGLLKIFMVVAPPLVAIFRDYIGPAIITVLQWLAPAITTVANALAGVLGPALAIVGNYLITYVFPFLTQLWLWFTTTLPAAIKTLAPLFMQTIGKDLMVLGQLIFTVVVPALMNLVLWFLNFLPTAIQFLMTHWDTLKIAILGLISLFGGGFLLGAIAKFLPSINGIVAAIVKIRAGVGTLPKTGLLGGLFGSDPTAYIARIIAFAGTGNLLVTIFSKFAGVIAGVGAKFLSLWKFISGGIGILVKIITFLAGLNPIILIIIAAIGLLAAAWAGNWFGIRDKTKEAWEGTIQPALKKMGEWFGKTIPKVLDFLGKAWAVIWPIIIKFLLWAAQHAIALALSILSLWNTISPFISKCLKWLISVIGELNEIVAALQLVFLDVIRIVGLVIECFVLLVGKGIQFAWGWISNWLIPAIKDLWAQLQDKLTPAFDSVKNALQPMLDKLEPVRDWFLKIVDAVKEFLIKSDFLGLSLEATKKALGFIHEQLMKVEEFFIKLKSAIEKIEIPAWLKGASPPPMANWLEYIATSASELVLVLDTMAKAFDDAISEETKNRINSMVSSFESITKIIDTLKSLADLIPMLSMAPAAVDWTAWSGSLVSAISAVLEAIGVLYDFPGGKKADEINRAKDLGEPFDKILGVVSNLVAVLKGISELTRGIPDIGFIKDALVRAISVVIEAVAILANAEEGGLGYASMIAVASMSESLQKILAVIGPTVEAIKSIGSMRLKSSYVRNVEKLGQALIDTISVLVRYVSEWVEDGENLKKLLKVKDIIEPIEKLVSMLNSVADLMDKVVSAKKGFPTTATINSFSATFIEILDTIVDTVKDWSVQTGIIDKLNDAANLVEPITSLLGLITPIADTIDKVANVSRLRISSEDMNALMDRMSTIVSILAETMAAWAEDSGFLDKLLSAVDIAQPIIDVIAVITPVIDAINKLVEFDTANTGGIGRQVGALLRNLRIVITLLARGLAALAEDEDLLKEIADSAAITEMVTTVLGVIEPVMAVIDAIVVFENGVNTGGIGITTSLILRALDIVIRAMAKGLSDISKDAALMDQIISAADIAESILAVIGVIQPAIDAMTLLATYKPLAEKVIDDAIEDFVSDLAIVVEAMAEALSELATNSDLAKKIADSATIAESINAITGVVSGAIDALQRMVLYVSAPPEMLAAAVEDFTADLKVVVNSISSALSTLDKDLIESAGAMAENINKLVNMVSDSFEAINSVENYEARGESLIAGINAFAADLVAMVPRISAALISVREHATPAIAELAKNVNDIVGMVNPAIEALVAMANYSTSLGLGQKMDWFVADLTAMLIKLAGLQTAAGAYVTDAIVTFSSRVSTIVSMIQPAIDALKAISTYEAIDKLDEKAQVLRENIEVALEEIKKLSDSLGDTDILALIDFSTDVQKIISFIQPVIDSIHAIATYGTSWDYASRAILFSRDIGTALGEFKKLGQEWTPEILSEIVILAESIYRATNSINTVMQMLQGVGAYTSSGMGRAMIMLRNDVIDMINGMDEVIVLITDKVIAKAEQFKTLLLSVTSKLQEGIDGLFWISMSSTSNPSLLHSFLIDLAEALNTALILIRYYIGLIFAYIDQMLFGAGQFIERWESGWSRIARAILPAINNLKWFNSALNNIDIPPWLQGASPPPMATWFDAIGDAASKASSSMPTIPNMQQPNVIRGYTPSPAPATETSNAELIERLDTMISLLGGILTGVDNMGDQPGTLSARVRLEQMLRST